MPYLKTLSKKEFKIRFTEFPEEINDVIDLVVLFNWHNLYPSELSNVYKTNIEVYGLGGNEKLDEYPYFQENFFIVYLPYINTKGKSVLHIKMIDYDEDIDKKERKAVIKHLKAVLPNVIDVDKIEFSVNY
jgi:hypothetical protein